MASHRRNPSLPLSFEKRLGLKNGEYERSLSVELRRLYEFFATKSLTCSKEEFSASMNKFVSWLQFRDWNPHELELFAVILETISAELSNGRPREPEVAELASELIQQAISAPVFAEDSRLQARAKAAGVGMKGVSADRIREGRMKHLSDIFNTASCSDAIFTFAADKLIARIPKSPDSPDCQPILRLVVTAFGQVDSLSRNDKYFGGKSTSLLKILRAARVSGSLGKNKDIVNMEAKVEGWIKDAAAVSDNSISTDSPVRNIPSVTISLSDSNLFARGNDGSPSLLSPHGRQPLSADERSVGSNSVPGSATSSFDGEMFSAMLTKAHGANAVSRKRSFLLEARIGYTFKNKELARAAITEQKNETLGRHRASRLEFLGTHAINLGLADIFFHNLPFVNASVDDDQADDLIPRLKELTDTKALASYARKLQIDSTESLEGTSGSVTESEAVVASKFVRAIGAVHADGGFEAVKGVLLRCVPEASLRE